MPGLVQIGEVVLEKIFKCHQFNWLFHSLQVLWKKLKMRQVYKKKTNADRKQQTNFAQKCSLYPLAKGKPSFTQTNHLPIEIIYSYKSRSDVLHYYLDSNKWIVKFT